MKTGIRLSAGAATLLAVAAHNTGVLYVAAGAAAVILVVPACTAALSRVADRRRDSLAVLTLLVNLVRQRTPPDTEPIPPGDDHNPVDDPEDSRSSALCG